ncbi:hypothetical protein AUEXF2481DRAFT_1851 [Aureobasidium subglaciale EXF-2481]|uniref:Uncharacterized protein n=1 Tax=Aureobasidium subglaciale (strain EXF-2481) TaxID=1043005 RepID=A0A074YMW0_AURSE|nr:uncharacterized protein AUEXF2481DRAFT_1851 [Aureobasidium subglaciale EXF-2481]KAI5205643.1 hypothetical protein E4T38_04231 [Aureobasidium subglaciale]KAI5224557.1 hypothetical protein E4T40_03957 [Aureobasidium subglaciale]KAI5227771.1 hypothetical protein E4T41_04177 [Aureobasidium subglaciale]KAI5263243.1 hypothetical protein E4T46_03798 [Aureobasidium subglaciale]KEQ99030.1 hypothetical protein AUEXF2481DRAFT_1851 [Aureobasidium subglaciale EXF-2481]
MFRAAPKLRTLARPSNLYRPLSTTAHLRRLVQLNESVRSHTVRFQNPPLFTPLRIASFILYSSCLIGYVWYFFPELEIEIQEGVADEQTTLSDSDFAHEDSFFIPMTWAKKLPRSFYKGSDPEWQEFVKVSKDKARHKKIQSELVKIVYDTAQKHPAFVKQLGRDTKVGQCWLDIIFPDGPPQEYARAGIEFGDDFVAYALQRIDAQQQHRITRTLWPSAAFNGIYNSTKVLAGIQYHRLKQLMGWEVDSTPGSHDAKYQHLLQLLQAQQAQQAQQAEQAKTQAGAPDANADKSSSASSLFPWAAKVPQPTSSIEMPIAQHIFHATLAQGKIPKKMEPPRGSFVVQGLIQLKGSRSILTLDVQAFYDPKASHFVVVNATPRTIKQRKQSPKGGD